MIKRKRNYFFLRQQGRNNFYNNISHPRNENYPQPSPTKLPNFTSRPRLSTINPVIPPFTLSRTTQPPLSNHLDTLPCRAQNLKFFNCGVKTRTLNAPTVISPLWRNNYLLMTGPYALTIAVYSFAPCNRTLYGF